MRPIVSIVGKSNSGKTTLLESLIVELKRRGHRVAVLKHSGSNIEPDTVNKDTWRFSQAGSEIAAVSSESKFALFKNTHGPVSPQELACFTCWDYDLVFTEGYKRSRYPKIEVHRKEQGPDLVSPESELIALVTDEPFPIGVPQFSKDEPATIVDLIERTLLSGVQDEIDIIADGVEIPASDSLKNLISRTLAAMLSSTGVREAKSLHISLRRQA